MGTSVLCSLVRMPSKKCAVCGKTAYPLESQEAGGNTYHKLCFKCTGCRCTLNVSTFKAHDGKVYCKVCCPKATHTQVADSVATRTALNAPKRKAEGLQQVQKGTGEKANVGLDAMGVQTALKAPKPKAEGLQQVQKGTGDKANVGLDAMGVQSALKAPKAASEGMHWKQNVDGEADTGSDRPAVAPPESHYNPDEYDQEAPQEEAPVEEYGEEEYAEEEYAEEGGEEYGEEEYGEEEYGEEEYGEEEYEE